MKLLYWNVKKLSNSRGGPEKRFDRVIAIIEAQKPDVIGLSEVSGFGIKRLDDFARDRGYSIIRRDPDGSSSQVVLLITAALEVRAHDFFLDRPPIKKYGESDVAIAAVSGPDGRRLTVGVLYNSSAWPTTLAQAQDFANRHTDGYVIMGGDYNMARSIDNTKTPRCYGTQGIELIEQTFGWTDVPPGAGGTEVPTWPFGVAGLNGSLRQIDRVFARTHSGVLVRCQVVVPTDALSTPRLSDHAMVQVFVERVDRSSRYRDDDYENCTAPGQAAP